MPIKQYGGTVNGDDPVISSGSNFIQSGEATTGASGYVDVVFPVAFKSPPKVVLTPVWGNSNAAILDNNNPPTATGFRAYVWADNGSWAASRPIHWIAVGQL